MVVARFKDHPDEGGKRLMLNSARGVSATPREKTARWITVCVRLGNARFLGSVVEDVIGLRGLVAAFLTCEAGFAKRPASTRKMFMEVIDEELEKQGIPQDVIFGSYSDRESR